MIDTKRLTLKDGLGYALTEIQEKTTPEVWVAFTKWFGTKPHFLSSDGTKCILVHDLQLYIRLRANALKQIKEKTK